MPAHVPARAGLVRRQEGLRRRRLRRVHGARRRGAGAQLLCPRRPRRRPRRSPRSRASPRRGERTRCSRVPGRAGVPVRLLHRRDDHDGGGADRRQRADLPRALRATSAAAPATGRSRDAIVAPRGYPERPRPSPVGRPWPPDGAGRRPARARPAARSAVAGRARFTGRCDRHSRTPCRRRSRTRLPPTAAAPEAVRAPHAHARIRSIDASAALRRARRRRGPHARGLPRDAVLDRPARNPARRPLRHAGARPDACGSTASGSPPSSPRPVAAAEAALRARRASTTRCCPAVDRPGGGHWRPARRCCTRRHLAPGNVVRRGAPGVRRRRGRVRGGRRRSYTRRRTARSGSSTSRWRRTRTIGWLDRPGSRHALGTGPATRDGWCCGRRPRCRS